MFAAFTFLPPPGMTVLLGVCLSVCLYVSRMAQKVVEIVDEIFCTGTVCD